MNIAIDGYEANVKNRVGIGKFAFEVLKNLHDIDGNNHYTVYLPNNPIPDLPHGSDLWKYDVNHTKGFWTLLTLPIALRRSKLRYDVFFTPSHYLPRFTPQIYKVISIMDLSYIYYPELFKRSDLFKLTHWTIYSIKNCQKIITISHFTKSEIINYYHVPADKIVVAYPGYDKEKFSPSQNNSFLAKQKLKTSYNITNNYLLFVGTIQPRKNIVRLIDAFKIVKETIKDSNLKLVIVGKKGWLYENIFQKIRNEKNKDNILVLDYIPDKDMPIIYKNAECLVLPSLYEGFGLPAIEAMACGTPAILSNKSSLPEIGGDAGIYIDPEDTKSIAEGIITLLKMNSQTKKRVVIKGFNNIKRFDWEKCSKIILKVLESPKNQ